MKNLQNYPFSVSLLMTGDEIMAGDLIDTNSHFICREIAELGGLVSKVVKTGDNPTLISSTIKNLIQSHSLVIINGGMGPTEDDYTVDCFCSALGIEKIFNADAMKHLEKWTAGRGYILNEANKKQAYLPNGSKVIDNMGSCSGFYLQTDKCMLIATPGVPSELKFMWSHSIREYIAGQISTQKISTKIFKTFGLGESVLQEKIQQAELLKNTQIKLGFRASTPYVDVKLTGVFPDEAEKMEKAGKNLYKLFSHSIISENQEELPNIVSGLLKSKNSTLATAESCTGGFLSSLFTKIPGASTIFKGGLVAYSNTLKTNLLGVPAKLIEKHGAVSKETAFAMLENTLRITEADYAISTTGIAGPEGGSDKKAVGTVFIGIGSRHKKMIYEIRLKSARGQIILMSSHVAIDLLRRFILDMSGGIDYYFYNCCLITQLSNQTHNPKHG